MAREETIRKVLDTVLWTGNASDDNKRILTNALIEALEQEPSDKQRYIVRGMNNDKIEFVDMYSARAFNRYVELIKNVERVKRKELLDKIRDEMQDLRNCSCNCSDGIIDDVEDIIDKCMKEYDEEKGAER